MIPLPKLGLVRFHLISSVKKSLKVPKGESETVNQRRTNNTMAKIKGTIGQTMIYKTLHRKLKIERHQPHKTTG